MAVDIDDTSTPPLKRHPTLQPLSREHMNGLIQARNLQRAASEAGPERARAVDDFVRAWRSEIEEHFDDEERLLLPLTSSQSLRDRLLDEHRAIREQAALCEQRQGLFIQESERMRTLGKMLHDHIRWEERVYFESVQREHAAALSRMEQDAAAIEERRPGARARLRLACEAANEPREGEQDG
jgi:hemerythrin-like domain-containing protein